MNTKFSPIIKVRKQNIDKIEVNLAKCRALRNELQESLKTATAALESYKFPKGGNANTIKISLEEQRLLREQKDSISEKLSLNQKEISHYEFQHKKAYIELEKIKYLHNEEIKKYIQAVKKLEASNLDEIAVQRYSFMKDQQ